MPYSVAWDEATPTNATDSDLIDDQFRSLKVSLRERFEDVLIVDWDADPIVLKAGVSGAKSKTLVIGPYQFSQEDNSDYVQNDEYIRSTTGSNKWFRASPQMPVGVTITALQVMIDAGGVPSNIVFGVTPFDDATTGLTSLVSTTSSVSGKTEVEYSGLSHTVNEDDQILIKISLNSLQSLYGCRILYDSPDSGATI